MTPILRHDRRGVSPVIATILLVAITVVLAAVLYVMVSGLFNPHNTTAKFLGVDVTKTGSGNQWILTLASVPTGVSQNDTTLALLNASGATALPAKTLFQLETPFGGVQYIPDSYGPATLAVGDRILISVADYPLGTQYSFVGSGTVLASGTLQ